MNLDDITLRPHRVGALREALLIALNTDPGLEVATLARMIAWSGESVRRELYVMEEAGLARRTLVGARRIQSWRLTGQGIGEWRRLAEAGPGEHRDEILRQRRENPR